VLEPKGFQRKHKMVPLRLGKGKDFLEQKPVIRKEKINKINSNLNFWPSEYSINKINKQATN
jgi:hypothetical protein